MKQGAVLIPSFFGYEKDVVNQINKKYNCILVESKIKFNLLEKIISKIFKRYKNIKMHFYIKNIFKKIERLDFLIIIFSPLLSKKTINFIRNKYNGVHIINYLWDSIANFPSLNDILCCCDVVYSFDKKDCQKFNLKFLPLFFPNIDFYSLCEPSDNKYDFCSIYSLYPNKINNYNNLKKFLLSVTYNTMHFSHIFVDKKYYLYYKIVSKSFRKISKNEVCFYPLKREEVYKAFFQSKVIIDCPLENQSGLSIRIFEALYFNKKIITTNPHIKDYDFYDRNNILVIQDYKEFPNEFLETEYVYNESIKNKYSLENFINTLLLTIEDL